MRENKYKVWCKDRNEWKKGKMMLFCDGSLAQLKNGLIIPCKQGTHIVVLYTGLLDKNSKEIYDSDYVKFEYPESFKKTKDRKDIHLVEFPPDFLWLETLHSGIEVVGNLYENPELLK